MKIHPTRLDIRTLQIFDRFQNAPNKKDIVSMISVVETVIVVVVVVAVSTETGQKKNYCSRIE